MKSILQENQHQKVPVKLWAPTEQVESQALDQLKNMASLPFVFKHIAAMPDVHLGKGATVGSVIATKNAVIPAAVGVDIGCGMCAIKTDLNPEKVQDKIRDIRVAIERAIPVGRDANTYISKGVEKWKGWESYKDIQALSGAKKEMLKDTMAKMGTLGGGNHFIEICLDKERNVWVMLHSGSRNVGKTVAESHIHRAKSEMRRLSQHLPDPDLAYFVEGTKEYSAYMRDLMWCQDYAAQNRVEMMSRVLAALTRVMKLDEALKPELEINCHHNYASLENHYGEEVLVTRKGAVRAQSGDYGIIPGSMGTKSYIVKGLGNPESFHSCAHGAGRRMSRTQAKARFSLMDLQDQTAGVECRKDLGVLDEIPAAYKDIDQVMENQKDLVSVVAELKQIMCVKG